MTTPNRRDSALNTAALGLAIFPTMRNTKNEYSADRTVNRRYYWPAATRHCASTSPEIIAQWWAARPTCNIKARLLRGQGCADVDRRNGGAASLAQLAAAGHIFTPTYEDESPDGEHYIYEFPPDITLTGKHDIAPGIEIHFEGGTVMMAGSKTAKGEYISRRAIPPQPAPDWLIEWARALQARLAMDEAQLMALPEMQKIGGTGCTSYGQAALSSECARVVNTPEGERNKRLYMAAFRMGQLCELGHLTADAITAGLQQIAQLAGWKNPRKWLATIRRGIRNGQRFPRRQSISAHEFTTTINNTISQYMHLLDAVNFAGKWAAGKDKRGRAIQARAENVRTWLASFLAVCGKAWRLVAHYSNLSASLDCHMSDKTARTASRAAITAGLIIIAGRADNVHASHWHTDARATVYMLTPTGWDTWRATIAVSEKQTLSPLGKDCGNFDKKGIQSMQRAGVFQWGALGASARPVVQALTEGAGTAAEIAARKGLPPATVYRALDKLTAQDMVTTSTRITSGRPCTVYALAPDAMNAKTAAAVERLYFRGRNVIERMQQRDEWINDPNPAKGRRAKFYQRIGMTESMLAGS